MEELKKKFIVEDKLEEKKLSDFVEKILPFCKVSKSGEVVIDRSDIPNKEKIGLALVARFLANHFEKEIPSEVGVKDLRVSLSIPENQVAARLKELKDDKFAIAVKRGVYRVNPSQIERFLKDLEEEYGAVKK